MHKFIQPKTTLFALAGFLLASVPQTRSEPTDAERMRRVNVAENKGLKISSDKAAYTHGDVMKITIETPADGFVIVYGVNSDGSTVILLPNPWQEDNSVKAGANVFPAQGARYHFPLTLDKGQTQVTESVHAVFSPQQFEKGALEGIHGASNFAQIGITTSVQRSTRGLVPTAKKQSADAELKYELTK